MAPDPVLQLVVTYPLEACQGARIGMAAARDGEGASICVAPGSGRSIVTSITQLAKVHVLAWQALETANVPPFVLRTAVGDPS